MRWDDWRVLGLLAEGKGGDHGRRLAQRDHYREVFHTPEAPTAGDLEELDRVRGALGPLIQAEEPAGKSWYKVGPADIPVVSESETPRVRPLSAYSSVIANMKPIGKVMLYVRQEDSEKARAKVREVLREVS